MPITLAQISSHSIQFPARSDKNPSYIFTLTIKNISNNSIMFKIKTKRLNTYEVKPPKWILEPNEDRKIHFKIIKPLSQEQLSDMVSKDRFLLEVIKINEGQLITSQVKKDKDKLSKIWKQNAQQKSNQQSMMLPVIFEDYSKVLKSAMSHFDDGPKIEKKGSLTSNYRKKQKVSDQKLSRMFEQLKDKQQKLMFERQRIFTPKQSTKQKSGISSIQICILILALLLSICVGNFLKLRVFVSQEQL